MATKFYFDFRDIFRAGRMGFKGKKMMMHFLGLMLGYVIYEIMTYLSLVNSGMLSDFWQSYGLRPEFFFGFKLTSGLPFVALKLPIVLPSATIVVMAIGALIWFIIYLLFSTAVAKVAIEELRGDEFYSMKDALKFAAKHWKSIYVAMLALIGIFLFCLLWPSLVGLIDLIPKVEQAAEHFGTPLTTFLTLPVYFLGLLMALVIIAFLFGILLIPAIVAVTGEDTFETIYQLFSTIWNQPWRLVIYHILVRFVATLGFAIFTAISIAGMYIAFLPSMLLAKQQSYYFADVFARALRIIDASPLIGMIPSANPYVSMPWTLDLATFFLFVSLIMIAAIVVAYPMAIVSCGYTILYVILRKKTTEENMLEVKEEKKEVVAEEKPEKVEEKKEEPGAEESSEEKKEGK